MGLVMCLGFNFCALMVDEHFVLFSGEAVWLGSAILLFLHACVKSVRLIFVWLLHFTNKFV
jgi:hypothetical protein